MGAVPAHADVAAHGWRHPGLRSSSTAVGPLGPRAHLSAHPEGTRNPIGRFDAHLSRFDQETQEKFYLHNMGELLGQSVRT